MGAINPMNYSLSERKLKIGKQAGKTVRIARARVRGRVSFARFCDLVAEHTTFNYMEVASILNLSADMARGLVAGGETVEYGRLGCLCPSLRSKAVVKEVDFNATTHILGARVLLRPNRSFFKLGDVTFERIEPRPQSKKKGKKKDSTTQPPNYGSEGGGHVGA